MTEKTVRRIPRLYKEAGKILQKVKEEGGSVKTLVYGTRHPNLKALYALVLETLKHGQQLDYLVRNTQILVENPRLNPWVTRVLMTELLWQKKALSAVSPPQEIVQSYREKFLSELANTPGEEANKDASNSSIPAQAVRYVRVNTLKDTTENVVKWFRNVGWEEVTPHGNSKKDFLNKVQHLDSCQFIRDFDIPDLLVFPHDFRFYETDLFAEGIIVLQDKASCAPPILLNPESGSVVLDMCAAPGMKTTQIAALMANKGTVYAVEINERRYATLCETVEKSGATCVRTIKGDVLHHSDLQDVEYIILDPPCSGSGMLSRKSIFGEEGKKDPQRLAKLANFQCTLLRHAMTSFPKVKRIVYSTCSVHPEENEAVVDSVLQSVPPNFVPVKNPAQTGWMNRGSSDYEHGSCGFYARPDAHLTNGFFVTVFERSDLEYECLSKPSTGAESASNLHSSEPNDKKKKKKRTERAHGKPGGDDDGFEKRVKKAELTDDAVQKMLKAMQKISKPQLTPSETADNLEVGDESSGQLNGSKKKKKKSKQNGEDIKDTVKRNKVSVSKNGTGSDEDASHTMCDTESTIFQKKKRKKSAGDGSSEKRPKT